MWRGETERQTERWERSIVDEIDLIECRWIYSCTTDREVRATEKIEEEKMTEKERRGRVDKRRERASERER